MNGFITYAIKADVKICQSWHILISYPFLEIFIIKKIAADN